MLQNKIHALGIHFHSFSFFNTLLLEYLTCWVTHNKTEPKLNKTHKKTHDKQACTGKRSTSYVTSSSGIFYSVGFCHECRKSKPQPEMMLTADTATSSHLAGRFFEIHWTVSCEAPDYWTVELLLVSIYWSNN